MSIQDRIEGMTRMSQSLQEQLVRVQAKVSSGDKNFTEALFDAKWVLALNPYSGYQVAKEALAETKTIEETVRVNTALLQEMNTTIYDKVCTGDDAAWEFFKECAKGMGESFNSALRMSVDVFTLYSKGADERLGEVKAYVKEAAKEVGDAATAGVEYGIIILFAFVALFVFVKVI